MAKSYEDQIKEMQNKISALKKKAKEKKDKDTMKIGKAIVIRFPELLEMMDDTESEFNIFEYVKTKQFANKVYAAYKQDEKKNQEETAAETVSDNQNDYQSSENYNYSDTGNNYSNNY